MPIRFISGSLIEEFPFAAIGAGSGEIVEEFALGHVVFGLAGGIVAFEEAFDDFKLALGFENDLYLVVAGFLSEAQVAVFLFEPVAKFANRLGAEFPVEGMSADFAVHFGVEQGAGLGAGGGFFEFVALAFLKDPLFFLELELAQTLKGGDGGAVHGVARAF